MHGAAIGLPGFSTLDRLVSRLRADIHGRIFNRVAESIAHDDAAVLDALLIKPPNSLTTAFNRLKQVPRPEPEQANRKESEPQQKTQRTNPEKSKRIG